MKQIHSFDVFDTLLYRTSGSRECTFLLTGKELQKSGVSSLEPAHFAALRAEAERIALSHAPAGEATLVQIYRQLAHLGGPAEIDACAAAELAIEAAHLHPSPQGRTALDAARRQSPRILFLSDMYVPGAWLREQLQAHGFWQEGDALYMSNEHGASKREGTLFHLVLRELGIPASSLIHHGDNAWSDVTAARAAGCAAVPEFVSAERHYESLLSSHTLASDGMSGFMSGAARRARLETQVATGTRRETLLEIAASVGAPMLTGYVAWVLHDAVRRGIGRLYFLSRDGKILQAIADVLVERLGLQLELRYLCVSRQVLRLATVDRTTHTPPGWAFDFQGGVSLASCFARLNLEPARFPKLLARHGFGVEEVARLLDARDQVRLQALLRDSETVVAIHAESDRMRELSRRYFAQEGLDEPGVARGLVDIGWRGDTFSQVVETLPETLRTGCHGYFFAFLNEQYTGLNGDLVHGYFHDRRHGLGIRSSANLVSVLEYFCATGDGTLLSYAEEQGRIRPVFRQVEHSPDALERVRILEAALLRYAGVVDLRLIDPTVDQRRFLPIWESMMVALWRSPRPEDIDELRLHRQEIDQAGCVTASPAEPYGVSEILFWAVHWRPLLGGIADWPEGRLLATPPHGRALLRAATAAHRISAKIPVLRRLPGAIRRGKAALRAALHLRGKPTIAADVKAPSASGE